MRRTTRLGREDSGQSLAEFALVLPVILVVFFGIFELSRFYYTQLSLQHAVREGARFAVTGNTTTDSETGEERTRANSIVHVIQASSDHLPVKLERITIDPADGGDPEEIVRVGVDFTYEVQLPLFEKFVPERKIGLTYSTAMRNEPFFD